VLAGTSAVFSHDGYAADLLVHGDHVYITSKFYAFRFFYYYRVKIVNKCVRNAPEGAPSTGETAAPAAGGEGGGAPAGGEGGAAPANP
jgi:hypothetical protein